MIANFADAQPFYLPAFKDYSIAHHYDKFLLDQHWGCNQTQQSRIKTLVIDTRHDPDPQIHVMLCLSAAVLQIRMNQVDNALKILDHVERKLPRAQMVPAQRADLLMLYGDIHFESGRDESSRSEALKYYTQASQLSAPGSASMGVLERKRGVIKRLLGEPELAKACLDLSVDALRDAAPRERVRSYQERAVYYFKRAGEDRARYWPLFRADLQSARSLIDANMQAIWREDLILQYYYEGRLASEHDLDLARECYEQAALVGKEATWECYSSVLPYCYNQMGVLLFDMGEVEQARDAHQKEIEYLKSSESDPNALVRACNLLGNCYVALDDPREAKRSFMRGLDYARQHGLDPIPPYFLMNYGLVLKDLEQFDSCRTNLYAALEGFLASGESNDDNIGLCYLNIGITELDQGHWVEGIKSLQAAQERLYLPDIKEPENCALLHGSFTLAYSKLDPAEAENQLQKALKFILSPEHRTVDFTTAAINVANYLNETDRPEQAITLMQAEMRRLVNGFNTDDPYLLPDFNNARSPWHILQVTRIKAYAFYLKYRKTKQLRDLRASMQLYEAAIQLVRKDRVNRHQMDSKLQVADASRSTFEQAMHVASQLYARTGQAQVRDVAFKVCEQSKSMILLEALLASKAEDSLKIPADSRARLHKIERDITLLKIQLQNASPSKQDSLRKLLDEKRADADALIEDLAKLEPRYMNQLYRAGEPKIGDLHARLHRDTAAVLEYFLTDSVLYTFIITADTFVFRTQPLPAGFNAQLRDFATHVRRGGMAHDTAEAFCPKAHALYKVLIGSIGMPLPERLIIIPDGYLSYIPFDALVSTPCKSGSSFQTLDYLLNSKIISYNYSAAFMLQEEPPKLHAPAKVLGVAPSFEPEDNLGILDHAREGVIDLAANYENTHILLDDEANVGTFQRIASEYDIIDLATHAIADTIDPMSSRLYFSNDPSGRWLSQKDVFSMKFNARLAVLEACQTGTGNYSQGEGVMSLARGFSYAQCRSVMMALWSVPDEETRRILSRFYAHMAEGMHLDRALTMAKRDYLNGTNTSKKEREEPRPVSWAGLMLIGDYQPIPLQARTYSGTYPFWMVFCSVLALIMGYLTFRGLRKRKRRVRRAVV